MKYVSEQYSCEGSRALLVRDKVRSRLRCARITKQALLSFPVERVVAGTRMLFNCWAQNNFCPDARRISEKHIDLAEVCMESRSVMAKLALDVGFCQMHRQHALTERLGQFRSQVGNKVFVHVDLQIARDAKEVTRVRELD